MGGYTHAVEYDGGDQISEISNRRDISVFANPLHRFNGKIPWALMLAPFPPGMQYADVVKAGNGWTQYIQAAGSDPETIMVEIRKPGGHEWGVQWVRYAVGHAQNGETMADTPVKLPVGTYMIERREVFGADEATDLFWTYFKTGEIPDHYVLRPLDGYTAEGAIFDLRDGTPRLVQPEKPK